jgi:hypothetical protein
MSYASSPALYPMSEDALTRSDVYAHGDGISNMDALSVQKYCAQVLSSLPESYS